MIKEFKDDYYFLSNFYPVKIVYKGVEFASVEHAYMSEKSDDEEWKKFCSDSSNSPSKVKKYSKHIELKDNWNDIKLQVMEDCLRLKFNQEPFKTMLIETGKHYLQEGNDWGDVFWGVCLETGKGKNHLGRLLMEIRNELTSSGIFSKIKK